MPLSYARWLRRNSTQADLKLWQLLNHPRFGSCAFQRQVWIGHYIVDFLCQERRLIVEVGGGQHGATTEYDAMRSAWLCARGYEMLRFWNDEVLRAPEAISERLWRTLESVRS